MGRTRAGRTGDGGGGAAGRGRTRWWLFAALTAVPALALLPVLVAAVGLALSDSDYPLGGGPEQVPCSEALGFGGAALPEGAVPTGTCTRRGWQDIHYVAAFRMPRAGVPAWLADTYPRAPAPETRFCVGDDVDLCLDLDYMRGLPDGVGADAVQVSVEYEDADAALVRVDAFTV